MSESPSDVDLQGNLDSEYPVKPTRKAGIMSLTLSNVNAREWLQKTRDGIKPWSTFLNTSKIKVPKALGPIRSRVVANIDRFQSNYLFVFIGLMFFCILTSPILLFALAGCFGACYLIKLRNNEVPIKIRGYELSLAHQYTIVGVISFPLFWLAGAGSAVFWVIGASMFVVLLHASLYMTEAEVVDDIEVLEMEEV